MKNLIAALLPLAMCLPYIAAADPPRKCREENLRGRYVFNATGFQRPPGSVAGTPWTPKAIVEVIQFNGDATLTTPRVTLVNVPFPVPDSGLPFSGPGAAGKYAIEEDCTGTVEFFDAGHVAFNIFFDKSKDELWMIQTNPNNVLQGVAKRVD